MHLRENIRHVKGVKTKLCHTIIVRASFTIPATVTVTALVADTRIYSVKTCMTKMVDCLFSVEECLYIDKQHCLMISEILVYVHQIQQTYFFSILSM